MKSLFLLVMATFIVGCSSLYKTEATKFELIRSDENTQVFKYTSVADLYYPLDSESAERSRMRWLESWLSENGYAGTPYKILSRTPIMKLKAPTASASQYDVYYEISVDRSAR